MAATPPRPASSVASSPLKSPAKKPERAAAAAAKKAAVAAAAAAEPTDDNKRVAVVDKRKRGGARPLGKYRVMVSSVTGDRWVTKLKALGADVINSETIENLRVRNNDKLIACVHYLADVPKASFKLLLALAVGAPIVSFEWIAACDKAAAYVDTAPYELPLNKVIDSDLPARRSVDRLQSMAGHRVELIGGTDAERKQLTLVLERLDVKVVKGDNRVLGNYELSAAISFGGPRAFARTEEMRAHRYTVVGIKWLKHCLVNGYVDPSDEKFAADEAMWLAGNHDDDDINNNGDNNEDTDDSDDEDSQPKPQRPSLRSKRKQPPAVVSKVEEDDEDEQSQSAAQEVASQAIVHKPKRSRVLESQADDVSHGGGAAPPLMVVEETDDEREEVDIDNIDDDSIVNVVDDIVDDAAADELVPPTQRSTSRSLVVPSDSLTMSPPAQEVRDTGELSLAFDEIGVSQMPAAATATVVRVVSRPMTPISSPPATAHLPQRRRAVEAVFSATLPSSDDEEEKEKPVNDLGSVVAARKYTAAMLPLAVHDREFEKEQRARDEDEMNGISRHYPAATQYS